jgi:competence protein ComFC
MLKIFTHLFNILFPIECLACGKQGSDICTECLENIHPPKKQNYDWITSFGNYHDEKLERIMRHIKSHPNARAANILAKSFGEMIKNRPQLPGSWILVPVPISKQRFRERGYNQCELLAAHFGQVFQLKIINDLLIKKKHTKKQGTTKSKELRATNIAGSFGIKRKYQGILENKNIIIIDDITTTGSTLVEIRNLLINTKATRVIAWTVAN